MYTLQQARAAIVRAAIHNYSREQLAAILRHLAPGIHIPNDCSILSLAYKLAWQLLPAGLNQAAQ